MTESNIVAKIISGFLTNEEIFGIPEYKPSILQNPALWVTVALILIVATALVLKGRVFNNQRRYR